MEDNRIEEILQEHFSAPDAETPRARILERACSELPKATLRRWIMCKWAVAGACIALIIGGNVADHARQLRMCGGLANLCHNHEESKGHSIAMFRSQLLAEDVLNEELWRNDHEQRVP